MSLEWIAYPAVILLALTSLTMLAAVDWRLRIGLLAGQYIGVFLLVAQSWAIEMAVVKLVAGWMAGAVLGMAVLSLAPAETPGVPLDPEVAAPEPEPAGALASPTARLGRIQPDQPAGLHRLMGKLFYLLTASLAALTVLSLAPLVATWIPGLNLAQVYGSLVLIAMGLLQLGFTGQPLPTVIGLLTALSGFEILYSAVESSTLVAGLLAAVNLGLALAGAYLLVAPQMED